MCLNGRTKCHTTLRFGDDIVLCAENEENLQNTLTPVNKILKNNYGGTQLNKKKTKTICRIAQAKRAFEDKRYIILTSNSVSFDNMEEIPKTLHLECGAFCKRNMHNE